MTITPLRWALACAFGCALLAVTLLPPEREADPFWGFWWRPQLRAMEAKIQRRENLVANHARLLMRNYNAAVDVAAASRVFGGRREGAADPVVWFAADVPQTARRDVAALVTKELAARGGWHGHGAVGVMVVTDTATKLDGVQLPTLWDRERSVSTVVLPAAEANGNHCVTVVRLRHLVLAGRTVLSTDRLPLDGCAFTDAFGAPGPRIAEWLRSSRYSFARRLSLAPPDTARHRSFYFYDQVYGQGGALSMRCRGGDDAACVDAARGLDTRENWFDSYWNDRSVRAPDESAETFGEVGGFQETFLETLVRDLGPARFQRMWRSPKSLPDAYFDETGEPFAAWVRSRLVTLHGPYHIGPSPTPENALLTVVIILALMASAIRTAPRPYAT